MFRRSNSSPLTKSLARTLSLSRMFLSTCGFQPPASSLGFQPPKASASSGLVILRLSPDAWASATGLLMFRGLLTRDLESFISKVRASAATLKVAFGPWIISLETESFGEKAKSPEILQESKLNTKRLTADSLSLCVNWFGFYFPGKPKGSPQMHRTGDPLVNKHPRSDIKVATAETLPAIGSGGSRGRSSHVFTFRKSFL